MKLFRNDNFIGALAALFAFGIYLATLSPSIGPEDAGELAAAAATLGVAHPTGYPLFSLLGRVFSLLPLGDLRVIVKLNLMGAVLCAAAAFVFYRLFLLLLRARAFGPVPTARGKSMPLPAETTPIHRIAAAGGVLCLAFSRVYWANGVSVEVYAFHFLFLALVLLLFTRALRAQVEGRDSADRRWLLFAYTLGLSFSNHMMTVLLGPALLYLYFATHGFSRGAWLKMARGVPVFLLGLTPYLYLPIRAALRPVINWGDPASWNNFLMHVSGRQYGAKMFSTPEKIGGKLAGFLTDLPQDLGYAALALAVVGAWILARRERRLGLALLLMIVTCVVYAVNYDFDDANFRIQAHVTLALAAAVGAAALGARASGRMGRGGVFFAIAAAPALLMAAAPLFVNYPSQDRSRDYSLEDYAKNTIAPLDSGALLFSDAFNFDASSLRYLQYVEGLRRDVVVLDYSMSIFSSHWASVKARAAFSSQKMRALVDRESPPREIPPGISRDTLRALMFRGIVARAEVPVYAGLEVPMQGLNATPVGIAWRMSPPETLDRRSDVPMAFRPLRDNSAHARAIRSLYALAHANLGIIAAQRGDTASGLLLLGKALELQPYFPEARSAYEIFGGRR